MLYITILSEYISLPHFISPCSDQPNQVTNWLYLPPCPLLRCASPNMFPSVTFLFIFSVSILSTGTGPAPVPPERILLAGYNFLLIWIPKTVYLSLPLQLTNFGLFYYTHTHTHTTPSLRHSVLEERIYVWIRFLSSTSPRLVHKTSYWLSTYHMVGIR